MTSFLREFVFLETQSPSRFPAFPLGTGLGLGQKFANRTSFNTLFLVASVASDLVALIVKLQCLVQRKDLIILALIQLQF